MKINWYKVVGLIPTITGVVLIGMNKYIVTGIILFLLGIALIYGEVKHIVNFFLEEKKKDGKENE